MYDDIIVRKEFDIDDRNLTKLERMKKVIQIWSNEDFREDVLKDLEEGVEGMMSYVIEVV